MYLATPGMGLAEPSGRAKRTSNRLLQRDTNSHRHFSLILRCGPTKEYVSDLRLSLPIAPRDHGFASRAIHDARCRCGFRWLF